MLFWDFYASHAGLHERPMATVIFGVRTVTMHDPGYLCDACRELAEPPWYPNARRRCAQSLKHVMPHQLRDHDAVLTTIAAFVLGNDP
jgi:hypothetical protein|tara:strand:+ start:817 stop:1080 length:264 start_codon:yes stop_codon:yes gene_type:complete